MANKRKTGTREWAESNFNIGIGCSHNCLYCYARANALRWDDATEESWAIEKIKDNIPTITKKNGWIMFPTTHDITPFYLPFAITALTELLEKGNKVLIVSKPHMTCIKALCKVLEPWKDRVLFRFTIGGTEERAKFWEPGAPPIKERVRCLGYAFACGFETSVSMEPMLGTVEETLDMFNYLTPHVTDKIWIGKMNKINNRVKKSSPLIETACNDIVEWQRDKNIMWLVNELRNNPTVEWKDSIKEVIEKYESTT